MAASGQMEKEKTVEVVAPSPVNGLLSSLIDILEKLLVKFMFDATKKPQYISGNFAPVQYETSPVTNLPVIGHLPECLNGEFVRVGPNPRYPPVAGYHWFDGDGMIHSIRIKDGTATYVNRYVKTSRLKQDEFFDQAKVGKVGDYTGLFGLFTIIIQKLREKAKVVDLSYGAGPANTGLVYHDGSLLALHESDKPYVIKIMEDGDLQTVGLLDYDKRLKHPFTAHPKVDPRTGEMFAFGYQFEPPYVTYRIISKDGVMSDPVPIVIPEPIVMHDFAITENYAIFMDLPLYVKPKEMVKNGISPLIFDKTIKARFGVLPRYAKDDIQIRWFELPNCYIFHTANAWEEGDEVILVASRVTTVDLNLYSSPAQENVEDATNELYEMRFNMLTGLASQKKLSESAVDFPRINESYVGRKQRYVYCTILDNRATVTGIVKFDLHAEPDVGKSKIEMGGNVQGIFELGPNRYGSEAIFVPREPDMALAEDDGYLLLYVHDENSGKSYGYVIDSKTMSGDPVAVVELPQRVPYGFHAFFVSEEQIKNQAKTRYQ